MENEVPFLSGTSGCASWRPLASAHGRAGAQSRAETHLVLSDCHYCASAEATLLEFLPAASSPVVMADLPGRAVSFGSYYTPRAGGARLRDSC